MSRRKSTKVSAAVALALAVVAGGLVGPSGASAATPTSSTRHVQKVGTGAYTPTPTGSGAPASIATEIPKAFGPEAAEGAGAKAATAGATGANRSLSRKNNRAGRSSAVAGVADSAAGP